MPFLQGPTSADTTDLCDDAALQASRETNVPLSVLQAITRTETGRSRNGKLQPWPWTVNMEGRGAWFDSQGAALAHVRAHVKAGVRSFDVGCFQINHRWHGEAFASLEEMFDPRTNALYAARFLARLHAETGNWTKAAGAYHSRTSIHADRYAARFDTIHARMTKAPRASDLPMQQSTSPNAAANPYPLLRPAETTARLGSLVPLTQSRKPALVSLPRRNSDS